MKCLNPQVAYLCGTVVCKSDGVISPRIVFSHNDAIKYYTKILGSELLAIEALESKKVAFPCGKCACCQIKNRKDMSTRLSHEASMHEQCCFLTLTYNDETVPVTDWNNLKNPDKQFDRGFGVLPERTLLPKDVQDFMKRLRSYLSYHKLVDKSIRYFAVGEYGSQTHRPHYHIMIFGWSPADKEVISTHNGYPIYLSSIIKKCWKLGYSSVSDVTPFVARYCARYVTKKFARLNVGSDLGYEYVVPEFSLQSVRNGGIGAVWFDKYGSDACKVGLCTYRCGNRIVKAAVPKYYFNRLRKQNVSLWSKLRDERIDFVKSNASSLCLVDFADLLREVDCYKLQEEYYSNRETF